MMYGCHNHKPYPAGYWGTERIYHNDGSWYLWPVFIEHRMSTTCKYDLSKSDYRCAGCKHKEQENEI